MTDPGPDLKAKKYQFDRRNKLDQIAQKRSDARMKLLEAITPILSEYSSQNGVSIILDKKNVILGKTEYDVTQTVIEILNKKLPTLKL